MDSKKLFKKAIIFENELIMGSFFSFRDRIFSRFKGLLGIDINQSSVRVVELRSNKSGIGFQLAGFGYAPMDIRTRSENFFDDLEGIAKAVSEAVLVSESKLKRAAIAVAAESVINKVVDVPCDLEDAELQLFLKLNADKYIPFSLEEVAIDFQKLNLPAAMDNREKVLLTACRRDPIDKLVAALNIAGISVDIVDVAPFATERALRINDYSLGLEKEDLELIADIGDNNIVCNLIDFEGALFVWEESIKTFESLNHSENPFGKAGSRIFQRTNPINSVDILSESSRKIFIEGIVTELKKALRRADSSVNAEVKNVVLLGSALLTEDILVEIQRDLDANVSIGKPVENMNLALGINPSELAFFAPTLTTACGLALRGFS